MTKKFQRTIEDFTCEKCGREVTGTGFTNHCPNCLWSKHVDVNPGDRANNCLGMMKPEGVAVKSGEYTITHRCVRCGAEKRNKLVPGDNFDLIVELSTQGQRR